MALIVTIMGILISITPTLQTPVHQSTYTKITNNKVRLMNEPPRTSICFQNRTNGDNTETYLMSVALWKNTPGLKRSLQNATLTMFVRHMVFSLKEYVNCTTVPYTEGSLYQVTNHFLFQIVLHS